MDVCKAVSKKYNAFHLIEFLFDVDVSSLESNDASDSTEEDEEEEDQTVTSDEDEDDEDDDQMNGNVTNLSHFLSNPPLSSNLSHQSDVAPTATSTSAVRLASHVYQGERIDVLETVVKGVAIMRRIDNNYMNLTSILKLVGARLSGDSRIKKYLKKKIVLIGRNRLQGTW